MITVDEKKKIFKLDTPNSSYIFGVDDGYLVNFYYGRRIKDADVSYRTRLHDSKRVPSENARDKNTFLDYTHFEFPGGGIGDYREHALEIETKEGYNTIELLYDHYETFHGKKKLAGLPATFGDVLNVETLEVTLKDVQLGVYVILSYSVFSDTDAIARSVRVRNDGQEHIYITKIMSTCVDLEDDNYKLLTLHGSWARERRMEYRTIGHGTQGVSSKRGETSHQEHPFMGICSQNLTQTEGEVYAFNFVYSGNFEATCEKNQFESLRCLMGIHPYNFKWKLMKGEEFQAPEAIMVYSHEGLSAMTHSFHELYRNHLIRSPYLHKQRPILINNWEATYFDFNTEKLLSIARTAKENGIEMLVMDDGWFGNRFDDNRALGDWIVNEEKLPGGLKYLVDEVNKIGLKFGIWMEPEMISPDSDLYRAHPDWAISVPGKPLDLSRNQLVLDITRPEVFEHVWKSIENILMSANIEYLKWDMNRQLCDMYSSGLPADRQGELYHRYVLAVYALQEKLVTTFPNLLLENCSGGGARFDPGMLYFSPQIWTSDDADAIERLKIQEGTALIYPLSTMGAHVSDCPNHAVGRVTPFETRGHVALAGTFGYELDVTKIPEEDRKMIPSQVAMYHKYNDLVREGDYYRLASYGFNNTFDAWMVKAKDDSEILVTVVNVIKEANYHSRIVKLQGLKEDVVYRDEETGAIYRADTLMYAGIMVERMWGDFKSKLIHLTKINQN